MQAAPLNSPSVLIAEDEVLIREALRRELEREYNVVAAVGNGQAAVDRVEERHPDIALLDISMPEMNGLEAAVLILAATPEMKSSF